MNTLNNLKLLTSTTLVKLATALLKLTIASSLAFAVTALVFSVKEDKMAIVYFFGLSAVPLIAFFVASALSTQPKRFNQLLSTFSKNTIKTAFKRYAIIALPLSFCITSLVTFDLNALSQASSSSHHSLVRLVMIIGSTFTLACVYGVCRACILCSLLKRESIYKCLKKISSEHRGEYPLLRERQSMFLTTGVFLCVVASPQNPLSWLIVVIYAAFDIANTFMNDRATFERSKHHEVR
ncbi:hypothetical protein [Vibrio barjaei]|uniref:hypothetical protein n=1 Tax=Vibrio barjaei TaxID=1676683 RepID=UPI002283A5EB|nr:hypothetical protein [Vibrio barjaei]MCY9874887.1 hypothetical protein [Vibrio barjaei]